jgi:hypothetical protein
MLTLDQILYNSTVDLFQPRLAEAVDVSQWTSENMDEKLESLQALEVEITATTCDFVAQALQPDANGNSALQCMVAREFYNGVLGFLEGQRRDLDVATDEELKSLPFNYEWLNEKIRLYNSLVAFLDEKLQTLSHFSVSDSVEAI